VSDSKRLVTADVAAVVDAIPGVSMNVQRWSRLTGNVTSTKLTSPAGRGSVVGNLPSATETASGAEPSRINAIAVR
jgi:hypothetical protein